MPFHQLQHTKFEDIRKQYLLRASHNKPIVFRHNGIIVAPMNTIAELDTFGDRVIAVEAIKDSDLASRTSPARRDPLEPLSNLALTNGGSVKPDTRIKPEPQDGSFNDENRLMYDSDKAIKLMKQSWDSMNERAQNFWIEQGRKLRQTSLPPSLYLSTTAPSSPLTKNTSTTNPLAQIAPVAASATAALPAEPVC